MQKNKFKHALDVLIVLCLLFATVGLEPAYAGAPWTPELVSPANGATASSNPPQLCARNMGDPEGEQVYIKFEVWGGGDSDHQSSWISAGSPGDVICWTDSGPWTSGTHSWQARAMANNEQSGASPVWTVNIPVPPEPQPECSINTLTTDPTSQPQPAGVLIAISASATCTNGVASLQFKVDGTPIGSVGSSSGTVYWDTTGAAPTGHTITVIATDATSGVTKTRSVNFDISAGAPPPTPDVNCTINSFNVSPPSPQSPGVGVAISGSASCNTGVRAMRILIDGGNQYELGAPSITWTWNTSSWSIATHTITLQAAGNGDDSWSQAASSSRSYELRSGVPTSAPAIASFSTGDIIEIGYDVFVIVEGQRRLVPNPDTLDALGIPRSWIDNKGFSDAELSTIPRGPDIPDVNRDPSGFETFKNTYFPNTAPISPSTPTPSVSIHAIPFPERTPVPQEELASDRDTDASEEPFFCNVPILGWILCDLAGEVSANTDCSPQCVPYIRSNRPDIRQWSDGHTPDDIYSDASSAPTFSEESGGQRMQVRVRSASESPHAGDLVIWPSGCEGVSSVGHIGYNTTDDSVTIIDANWDNSCGIRTNEPIEVSSCVRFITEPYPANSSSTENNEPNDGCSRYIWPFNWFCSWGWIK